jgi:hypothetical protein
MPFKLSENLEEENNWGFFCMWTLIFPPGRPAAVGAGRFIGRVVSAHDLHLHRIGNGN